jgi:predicted GIY-YIG superfamily endonuclease
VIGYIYTLACSKTGTVFYVGSTENIAVRLSAHLSAIKTGKKMAVYEHIRKNRIIPVLEVVEEVFADGRDDVLCSEEYWIEQFRQWGFLLLNKMRVSKASYERSGSIKVVSEVLEDAKKICKDRGFLISAYITKAIDVYNKKHNPELREKTL